MRSAAINSDGVYLGARVPSVRIDMQIILIDNALSQPDRRRTTGIYLDNMNFTTNKKNICLSLTKCSERSNLMVNVKISWVDSWWKTRLQDSFKILFHTSGFYQLEHKAKSIRAWNRRKKLFISRTKSQSANSHVRGCKIELKQLEPIVMFLPSDH